jgi:peptidoglycan/xylan/chitin deacetylase (PgdA/CDA1 family)
MALRPRSALGLRVAVVGLALSVSLSATAAAQEGSTESAPETIAIVEVLASLPSLIDETKALMQDAAVAVAARNQPTAKVVRMGRRDSGAVALTFDDGFNLKACARIADTLRQNGAVGTFFINGNHLKSEPAKWRGILDGMQVANHTRSHHRLTSEPHPVVIKQIRQNEAIHERVLGRPMLRVLRPPYGSHGDRIGRIAAQLGYERIVLWNVDTNDWKPSMRPDAIVRRATGAPPGSIILMHCSRNATARALPRIVRHYQRRGIELAGLKQVLDLKG